MSDEVLAFTYKTSLNFIISDFRLFLCDYKIYGSTTVFAIVVLQIIVSLMSTFNLRFRDLNKPVFHYFELSLLNINP
jgi:hypothetical protein